MDTVENLKLNILEKAHSYAKIYASLLTEEFQRKRAYASIVALYALVETLEKTDAKIQKSMTLFRNPRLNEQYEISDLYVNDWHVDVRVVTEGDGVLVPKIHFESKIVPDFYAVVKVNKSLTEAELLGFVKTADTEFFSFDTKYNYALLSSMISFSEFMSLTAEFKGNNFADEDHEFFQNYYLSLMDEEIDLDLKNKLINHMFSCNECRTEFCCFTGFEMVSCNSSKYDDLLLDRTLDIIGANVVDDIQYEGKEETIYFDKRFVESKKEQLPEENIKEETTVVEEVKEQTVSDILDELFSIQEMTEETPRKEKFIDSSIEIKNVEESAVEQTSDDEEILSEGNVSVLAENSIDEGNSEKLEVENEQQIEAVDIIDEQEDVSGDEQFTDDDVVEDSIEEATEIKSLESEENEANILLQSGSEEVIEKLDEEENSQDELIDENIENIESDFIEEIENTEEKLEDNIEETVQMSENEETLEEEEVSLNSLEETSVDSLNDEEVSASEEMELDAEIEIHTDEVEDEKYTELNAEPEQFSEEKVQKVIVDYDEDGEPVYSYVNGVGEQDDEYDVYYEESSDLETADEDVLNEKFETYADADEEIAENISKLDGSRPVEYVNVDANVSKNSNSEKDEQSIDENQLSQPVKIELEEDGFDDEDNSEVAEVSDFEDEYVSDEAFDEEETEDEVDEDEKNDGLKVFDEDVEEYSDDEEFEGYDDENIENLNSQKGGKKGVVIALIIIILLLVGSGFAGFSLFKNKLSGLLSSENKAPEENNQQVQEEVRNEAENPQGEENNDMFGEPQEEPVEGELINSDNNEELPPPPETENVGIEIPEEENHVPPLTEADLIEETNQQEEQITDPGQAMANAFSGTNIVLKNINWLCAKELFSDKTFNAYLQDLDNKLKMNLRKNILDATEPAQTDTISVKMAIDNMGNILKVMIADSSGSAQIDDIVLRSINETFEGEKHEILNGGALKADKYYLKVVIKI